MSIHRSRYAAVVVGAGPAGICAVGNLLDRKVTPILWVDDDFSAGRVNKLYRDVPSNTKTKLFIDFAEALESFRNVVKSTPSPNAIDHLRGLEQDKGTQLGDAADMFLMLTEGLIKTPGVEVRRGRVATASIDAHKGWTVTIEATGSDSPLSTTSRVISSRVILCTGASPAYQPLPIKTELARFHALDLDTSLSQTRLAQAIGLEPTTVGVVGGSHSAVLVLLNLAQMALSSHPNLKIKWFTRSPLRYAIFMDGWTLRDNTGLKGHVADWARNNLEPESFANSPVSECLTIVNYTKCTEAKVLEAHISDCDFVVQAIGYTRDVLPHLKRGVGTLDVDYDPLTGAFQDIQRDGEKIPGLYGAGIAFPEKVTDPHGNVEYAVGFWKFMRYMKRVVCDWN